MDLIESQSNQHIIQKWNYRIQTIIGVKCIYQLYPFILLGDASFNLVNIYYKPSLNRMENFQFWPEKLVIYNLQIKRIVTELNQLKQEQIQQYTHKLLKQLKDTDNQFMKSHGIENKGHLCFTRHGQCKNWSEKTFGMNPNAALAQQAVSAMGKTHSLTNQIICFPQQVCLVRISPLIRAKQTASLVLPGKRKYDIKLQYCLTQNSGYPSGTLIRSKEQLKQYSSKTSIFDNFGGVLTFKIAQLLYSKQDVFLKMSKISQKTDQTLLNLGNEQNDKKLIQNLKDSKKQLQKIQKVKQIKQIIQYQLKQKVCDLWFFGHNNNIKTFFNILFSRNESLSYGETRRLYKIDWKSQELYFQPSYNLVINQSDGSVRGRFSPEWLRVSKFKNF